MRRWMWLGCVSNTEYLICFRHLRPASNFTCRIFVEFFFVTNIIDPTLFFFSLSLFLSQITHVDDAIIHT